MPKSYKVIADLRGGRNASDPPLSLPANQCTEALNVDWYDGLIARKRPGSDSVTETGGTAFSSGIQTLARYVPGNDDTAAEFWGVDGAATPIVKRMAGGTSFANVTVDDAIATRPQDVVPVTLNGKLFLFYDSTKDRIHVYDPAVSAVRPVGLAASSAPTVANTGVGAYAAVARFYKQDTIQLNGTIIVRQSELSPSVSFTPSGAGTAARVTRGTFPNERETHWRVWGSSDGVTYFNISGNIVVGTTTYDDSAAVSSYSANTVALPVGTYTLPTSGKYGMTDGNRLLFAGAWETGGKSSRVWYTPVLGSLDQGDDERLLNTSTIKSQVDLNENDGGSVTGLGGPLGGSVFVFKYRRVWKLVPTGDVTTPYLPRQLRSDIGCIAHKTICVAEDESGQSALYWLSHKGPYRAGANGIQYLGRDCEDVWKTMNLGATTVVAHSVYHADIHQWWVWVATGASNDPDTRMVFDTLLGHTDDKNRVRGGWAKHTGDAAAARCSTLMSNTLAAAMSRDLKPYIGRASGTTILKCDTAAATDASTPYASYVVTAPISGESPLGVNLQLGSVLLLATAGSAHLQLTTIRDFGVETVPIAAPSLAAAGSETRVFKKLESDGQSGNGVLQLQMGDTGNGGAIFAWTIDALVAPITTQEPR